MKMPNQGEETIDAFTHYYDRPYEIPKKETIWQFIYNSEAKTVLNRSGSSWGEWNQSVIKTFILKAASVHDAL